VIAVSQALQQKISMLAPVVAAKVVHIPCAGVDPDVFMLRDRNAARDSLGYTGEGRILLFVGQLVPVKAVDVLISAWQRMLTHGKARRGDRLVIVGDGPERSNLETQVVMGNMKDTVLFVGDIPQASVARWMSAATALCLPSRNEGTPNVLIEALASGRPVVASRVGGVPEVISEDRTGILVEADNDLMLSDALAAVFDRQWDEAEIAATIADCTWSTLARRNIAVFRHVLQNQRVGSACLL
jgi:glycosyltransferase involved in cell wall biosynthesis